MKRGTFAMVVAFWMLSGYAWSQASAPEAASAAPAAAASSAKKVDRNGDVVGACSYQGPSGPTCKQLSKRMCDQVYQELKYERWQENKDCPSDLAPPVHKSTHTH
jgi:hypothetical protein